MTQEPGEDTGRIRVGQRQSEMETNPESLGSSSASGDDNTADSSGAGANRRAASDPPPPSPPTPNHPPAEVATAVSESTSALPNSPPVATAQCPSPQAASSPAPVAKPKEPEAEKPPKPWILKVRVTSQRKGMHPSTMVTVLLKPRGTSGGGDSLPLWMFDDDEKIERTGTGPRDYEVSVDVERWDLIEKKTVTLNDGDDKTVELVIKPRPWIAFKVVNQKNAAVKEVTLKVTLPGNRKEEPVSANDAVTIFDIREAGTAKIEGAIHATECFEVVEVKSESA